MIASKVLAEVYRLGLLSAFFNVPTVVRWADLMIEYEDNPDYYLIEVSLSANKSANDIASKLRLPLGIEDKRHALKILLGLMFREIKLDISKSRHIARVLYNLSNHMERDLVDDRKLFFMNTIDDSFDLAERMIYGEIDEVKSQLVHFLQEYQEDCKAFVLTDNR